MTELNGWIKLDDGKYLLKHYGKYNTDLLIISSSPEINWSRVSNDSLNLSDGNISEIIGNFFKTKKGSLSFEITVSGSHKLLRDNWGGCFNSYRGETLPNDGLYYCRKSSNGGGTGYDYCVVDIDWKNVKSLDDF